MARQSVAPPANNPFDASAARSNAVGGTQDSAAKGAMAIRPGREDHRISTAAPVSCRSRRLMVSTVA